MMGHGMDVVLFDQTDALHVASWCPDHEAKQRPVQVHVILPVGKVNVVVRFKTASKLTEFINELAAHRAEVWPCWADPP